MEKKTVFFPYETLDYKAAEARLNALGAGGWRLKRIMLGRWARLEREGREPLRCCVDVNRETDRDYAAMCAEAGWHYVCCVRHMDIYISHPGARPVPIQTDPGMEMGRLFRQVVLREWFNLLVCVGFIALFGWLQWNTGRNRPAMSAFLLSDMGLFSLVILAVLWAAALVQLFSMTARVRRCRRLAEAGKAIPTPGRRGWRHAAP